MTKKPPEKTLSEKKPLRLTDDAPQTPLPQAPADPVTETAEKIARRAGFRLEDISWGRIFRRLAVILGGLLLLLTVFLAALNTPPGRRMLVQFATGIKLNSGLQFQIDRIDGSLYGKMTIHGLRVVDTKGVFIEAPVVNLDWRPFGYLDKHVDIRDLDAPRIEVLRQPVLNPSQEPEKSGPILPDLRIDLNRVQVGALVLDEAVAGQPYTLRFGGAAHILHRRAQVSLDALSDKGDRLSLHVDAVPDANKLDIDAHALAPKDGAADKLLGFGKPVIADLTGKGSWANWQGRFVTQYGVDPLSDLNVSAQNGVFHITGAAHPDRLLDGESAVLLQPQVNLDATAKMKDRVFDLNLALATQALDLKALGVVDLGHNRFKKLEAHLRLLQPQALGKDVSADDLHADLVFNGAFDAPKIDYDIAAKRFGLGAIRLTGLDAQGHSRKDGAALIIPLKARLDSLTGINTQVDPLLTHLKLDGELSFDNGRISSKTLKLQSDRLKATGTVSGDVGKGQYGADAQVALNNYTVQNIATLNASTKVRLAYGKAGLSASGTLNARTTKILNDGLAKALGGDATVGGGYAYAANGAIAVRGLKLAAPKLTMTGDGGLAKSGALTFKANAESVDYGPADLSLSGTLDHPQGVLHAARPGLGVGVVNVTASFESAQDGYAVKAEGGSDYGPFDADTLIVTQTPLSIDIHHADFAGIGMAGRLTQSEAGPFAGTLDLSGAGLNGTAQLSAAGQDQAATVHAVGNQFTVPGPTPIRIGRALIDATVVLRDQAKIDADVQMANVTYNDMTLATGRAKIALIGQNGTVQAVANGASGGVPVNLAANAQLTPNLIRVAAQGMANGVAFHTQAPARLVRSGEDWALAPATLVMDAGKLDVAGRFGADKTVQLRLHDLDLSVANLFQGDLGVTGTANGAIDLKQNGDNLPYAHATLKISRFSRASAAVASAPVDMEVEAGLDPDALASHNYVHALIRQNGGVIGRVQIGLTPDGGADWMKRLLNGSLSGGVRYNGPAAVPFSLAGLPRQQLTGAVALAADVSGKVADPQLNGVVKADSLTYDNETLGTRITQIGLSGRFTSNRLELDSFTGRAGDGTVSASGWLSLAADQHFPMALHADLKNARLARSDAINSVVSGTLDVTNDAQNGPLIKGDLRLPQFKYQVVKQGAAEVNVLDGVHRKGEDLTPPATDNGAPSRWKLDVRIRASNQVFVSGMGLDSEWSANLRVTGTSDDPRIVGEMKAIRGDYTFAGRAFNLDSGTITFDGGKATNPELNISASANISDIEGVITITGTAERPQIGFSSTPSLPQDEILSRMLFGESVANISPTEALQLASAVNGLNGGTDYLNPLGVLRNATGIDRLRVVGADAATGRGTSIAAGKYLTNNVYVEIVTDTKGFTATQFQIALSRALSLLSQTGGVNGTSVSLRYSKDY
jgi:translocation and assembly module TamB